MNRLERPDASQQLEGGEGNLTPPDSSHSSDRGENNIPHFPARTVPKPPVSEPIQSESDGTRIFCKDAGSLGCFFQVLSGSLFQKGVPDRYFLSRSGKHTWVEFKLWDRVPPSRIDWKPLFGGNSRALQDEFIRSVYFRDPTAARVCAMHVDKPEEWALYVPVERPQYQLVLKGRDAILKWVTDVA